MDHGKLVFEMLRCNEGAKRCMDEWGVEAPSDLKLLQEGEVAKLSEYLKLLPARKLRMYIDDNLDLWP